MQKVMFYDKAGLLAKQIKILDDASGISAAGYCPDGRRTGAIFVAGTSGRTSACKRAGDRGVLGAYSSDEGSVSWNPPDRRWM